MSEPDDALAGGGASVSTNDVQSDEGISSADLLNQRMLLMAEKYKTLAAFDFIDDDDDQTGTEPLSDGPGATERRRSVNLDPSSSLKAKVPTRRWSKIAKVVGSVGPNMRASVEFRSIRRAPSIHESVEDSNKESNKDMVEDPDAEGEAAEEEKKQPPTVVVPVVAAFDEEKAIQEWDDLSLPTPPEVIEPQFMPPPVPAFETEFDEESKEKTLVVSSVPVQLVNKQKQLMELAILDDQRKSTAELRAKESDVIWREHLARQRVIRMEDEAKLRLAVEKQKILVETDEKKKKIGRDFKRATERLNSEIQQQLVYIRERFGEVLIAGATLARRYGVQSTKAPQPVEVRIHCLRAVKTKLPKGSYVMMLSQYESLGGGSIAWSKFTYGIGDFKSAATRPVKHFGCFYDREVVIEDSVYCLCPPKHMLRPSFVLALELFQLASKTNPVDRIVGWTALPMCTEHMAIVEGTFRLPLLRGEMSPLTEQFRSMEKDMIDDLNNWLCNCYIEVIVAVPDFFICSPFICSTLSISTLCISTLCISTLSIRTRIRISALTHTESSHSPRTASTHSPSPHSSLIPTPLSSPHPTHPPQIRGIPFRELEGVDLGAMRAAEFEYDYLSRQVYTVNSGTGERRSAPVRKQVLYDGEGVRLGRGSKVHVGGEEEEGRVGGGIPLDGGEGHGEGHRGSSSGAGADANAGADADAGADAGAGAGADAGADAGAGAGADASGVGADGLKVKPGEGSVHLDRPDSARLKPTAHLSTTPSRKNVRFGGVAVGGEGVGEGGGEGGGGGGGGVGWVDAGTIAELSLNAGYEVDKADRQTEVVDLGLFQRRVPFAGAGSRPRGEGPGGSRLQKEGHNGDHGHGHGHGHRNRHGHGHGHGGGGDVKARGSKGHRPGHEHGHGHGHGQGGIGGFIRTALFGHKPSTVAVSGEVEEEGDEDEVDERRALLYRRQSGSAFSLYDADDVDEEEESEEDEEELYERGYGVGDEVRGAVASVYQLSSPIIIIIHHDLSLITHHLVLPRFCTCCWS